MPYIFEKHLFADNWRKSMVYFSILLILTIKILLISAQITNV